ncbi:profilin-1-like [Cololabis saira]|uniref:profilin-1-like n=1 Tax=Cololabis saira TaxID=129043 RepID=UPI002AD3A970|nr:profilin-1-like [Cololabis saira]
MSWQAFIERLTDKIDGTKPSPVEEAAICGIELGKESVWASTTGAAITVEEIKKLASEQRSDFAQNGVHVFGRRCRLIRDQLDVEGVFMMDLKTAADAEGNTYGVCVSKTKTAIIVVRGTKDANGGQLSTRVYSVADYLRGLHV